MNLIFNCNSTQNFGWEGGLHLSSWKDYCKSIYICK